MERLKDKVAIITGAGSGIAKTIAQTFANEGAKVVCADIKGAEDTAEEIKKSGGESMGVTLDVTQEEDWKKTVKKTVDTYGTVDILNNVAGISEAVNIMDLDVEKFDQMMAVNVRGVFLGMKHTLPIMKEKQYGKIVNIASLAAHIGLDGLPSYSGSKGAVIAMSRQVGTTFAKDNIQVNAVSPGIIDTPILRNNSPEMTKKFTEATPAGRLGKTEDIANMVLFLSSDESNFVTAQAMLVDGGWAAS